MFIDLFISVFIYFWFWISFFPFIQSPIFLDFHGFNFVSFISRDSYKHDEGKLHHQAGYKMHGIHRNGINWFHHQINYAQGMGSVATPWADASIWILGWQLGRLQMPILGLPRQIHSVPTLCRPGSSYVKQGWPMHSLQNAVLPLIPACKDPIGLGPTIRRCSILWRALPRGGGHSHIMTDVMCPQKDPVIFANPTPNDPVFKRPTLNAPLF